MKKKKRARFTRIVIVVLILVVLAMLIPIIGTPSGSPQTWIDIVSFFQSLQEHFRDFWMFYFFALSASIYLFNK